MSRLSLNSKAAAWLAFGAVGLATGTVWASGFATSTGANRTNGTVESPALVKTAPVASTSALASTVTDVDPIEFDWTGRWGNIHANTVMFSVDLTAFANTKKYNVATLLANTSTLTGWASLQIKFEQVDIASGACDASDFTGSSNAKLLNVDDQDAGVYWNNLDGGSIYCLGVSSTTTPDMAATFLRSANDAPPSVFPTFITTVDRTA